ncbi:MAG: ABC transporter ATP-binding protein [Thermoguttaceae bacterium]|nr:ABC transporter ATP-binding protein [Thermoguttaceae bacterium]MDW8038679.1 ABC transporter ATP-binding protein [Thermoguttaceae bacterium]
MNPFVPMIEFQHVRRTFGRTVAVDDLSLSVLPGEIFAFLGPNGAGKTTTIKMLVGLLHPSQGTIRVAGWDVVEHPREAAQLIGYVPDEPFLYDKLTGREFLDFIARVRGMSPRQAQERIAQQAELFQLEDFLDQLTETYSHGMKQRIVFASVLLHDPPLLVADEPMIGLDPRSVRLVKDLMRARAAEGKTVFISTHTLALAEEIADRIGIIHRGRLIFVGSLAQMHQQGLMQDKNLEEFFLELTNTQLQSQSSTDTFTPADSLPTSTPAIPEALPPSQHRSASA